MHTHATGHAPTRVPTRRDDPWAWMLRLAARKDTIASLEQRLGRRARHLAPASGKPKIDLVLALADALEWTPDVVIQALHPARAPCRSTPMDEVARGIREFRNGHFARALGHWGPHLRDRQTLRGQAALAHAALGEHHEALALIRSLHPTRQGPFAPIAALIAWRQEDRRGTWRWIRRADPADVAPIGALLDDDALAFQRRLGELVADPRPRALRDASWWGLVGLEHAARRGDARHLAVMSGVLDEAFRRSRNWVLAERLYVHDFEARWVADPEMILDDEDIRLVLGVVARFPRHRERGMDLLLGARTIGRQADRRADDEGEVSTLSILRSLSTSMRERSMRPS